MRLPLVVAAAAFALVGAAAFGQQVPQATAGDAKQGQTLYRAVGCWECHGTQGQGGALTAPKISDTQLPFDAFLQQLRTPQNQMPPYEPKILPHQEAADIYAFLKSIPPARSAKDVPILDNLN